jgi:hypothetical protein
LEALEARGLTLSKLEKLLPLVDNLGLLPLLVKNQKLVLLVAPLLIEPATALLPAVVSLVRASPSTFQTPGFALLAAGGYETVANNGLIGVPLALLGAPLVVFGTVLGSVFGNNAIPAPAPAPTTSAVKAEAAPRAVAPKVAAAPKVVAVAAPKVAAPKVAAIRSDGGNKNGKRKTIKL